MSIEKEYFPEIKKIVYNPYAPREDCLVYRHYNENEIVLDRSMKEWLRLAVCCWHTFCWQGTDPFGNATLTNRPWNFYENKLEQSKERIKAAFEFFTKLGNPYWTFHDRDIAPEGLTLEETNRYLDEIVDLVEELQNKTGVKLLWGTSNLFSSNRYANGASTNPNVYSFAYAGTQVKKMLEITKRLKGENFVFWGGREGYQSLLNTNVKYELEHMEEFLRMAVDYKQRIGFNGQLLLEPKPKEPTKHQYDYDAQTCISFLKSSKYGLDKYFKLNIEPNHTQLAGHSYEHDIIIASQLGYLGSIDINTGESSLGWDTDQFLMDPKLATQVCLTLIKQNGLQPGGLNFDCKVRRESIDLEDVFIAHIGAIDTLAYGLKKAAQIYKDGLLERMLNERYLTYKTTDLGKAIDNGQASLEQCEEFILKQEKEKNDTKHVESGKQEKFETIFNSYFI